MPPISPSTQRHHISRGLAASTWGIMLLWLTVALGSPAARAVAQEVEVKHVNPDDPRLVINPGGHTAPVRSLIFTEAPDGGRLLLSAGFDKVIHVWSLDDGRPRLVRTLRPPIYRGLSGSIYAIALSPKADDQGQRLLAVGGYGVRSSRGTITLFRFPGTKDLETGDVAGVLPEGYVNHPDDPAEPKGHTKTVTGLAFHPSGRFLASASMDGTVRLWNLVEGVKQASTLAVLHGDLVLRMPQDLPILNTNTPQTPAIQPQSIAFTPDGQRLLVGDQDTILRLWDLTNPSQPRLLGKTKAPVHANPQRALANTWINSLAISPDGRWAMVGQESGLLTRFDLTDRGLTNPANLPTRPEQGPIESIAFSQDPNGPIRLISSILQKQPEPVERPAVDCDIEVWDFSDGRVSKTSIDSTNNLSYACAFSPDNSLIVYSGGDAQGLYVHHQANQRLAALEGKGRSIWNVGFTKDSKSIAFALQRPERPEPLEHFQGLDLIDLERTTFPKADLQHALHTMQSGGWSWRIQPVDSLNLQIIAENDRGRSVVAGTISLNVDRDGRWWDYSFLPNGRGGYRKALAIACESGSVLVFKLQVDGQPCERLREYAGHNGAVYSLAPAPDGRWLATGSSDQTISLWRLEGCETPAPFGARFEVRRTARGADLLVKQVDPLGFAAQMGLKVGDVVDKASFADNRYKARASKIDALPALLDEIPPNVRIDLRAWRLKDGAIVPVGPIQEGEYRGFNGTSKRDNPALTLFADNGGDWVAWMPQGYYETSAKGDQEYLGWHHNRIALAGATKFSSAADYKATYRRQDVLATLIRSANPIEALQIANQPLHGPEPEPEPEKVITKADAVADADADAKVVNPPPVVEPPKPPPLPEVRIVAPAGVSPDAPLVALGALLPLTIQAQAPKAGEFGLAGRPIRSLVVKLDNWTVQTITPPEPSPTLNHQLDVPLRVGRQFLSVSAIDDQGRGAERGVGFEVEYYPAQPGPKPQGPRLWVLSLGAERFADPGWEISNAGHDARAVADFLLKPGGKERFPRRDRVVLDGQNEPANAATLQQQFEQLGKLGDPEETGEGLGRADTLFVFLESHLLDLKETGLSLLGAEGQPEDQAALLPADMITQTLGQVADYGCKVVLLLDLVHETSPESRVRSARLQRWIRQLCYERGVIVVTASSSGPGLRAGEHGAFALGLIDLFQQSPTRLRDDPNAPWTLDDFQDALAANVARYTQGRAQRIGYYKPWTYKGTTLLFDPPDSPAADRLAKARASE